MEEEEEVVGDGEGEEEEERGECGGEGGGRRLVWVERRVDKAEVKRSKLVERMNWLWLQVVKRRFSALSIWGGSEGEGREGEEEKEEEEWKEKIVEGRRNEKLRRGCEMG